MHVETGSYGLEEYIQHHGDGSNRFRGEAFSQPLALVEGDILAGGQEIAGVEHGGNGSIVLNLTDGTERFVAARIPLLLDGGVSGKLPIDLRVGDILETGCVVLDDPVEIPADSESYEKHGREIGITITGGFRGANIEVPGDLVIALHDEAYPPSQEALIGSWAVRKTLSMGARARRKLPNYGRLDGATELERVEGVFDETTALLTRAHEEKAIYNKTLEELAKLCEGLRGVELLITGTLYARRNLRIFRSDPNSQVEGLHIEVASASVYNYESSDLATRHIPCINVTGYTVKEGEQVSAYLGVGKSGVSIQIVEPFDPNSADT